MNDGSTPRTDRPARAPFCLRSRFTPVVNSAEAAGPPPAARAIPGASLIAATASTSSVLENSPVAPARSTMARSSLPVASTAPESPRVNAETDMMTATTPAMPTTTTDELASRWGTLRRFIRVTDAICLSKLMSRDLLRSRVNAPRARRRC